MKKLFKVGERVAWKKYLCIGGKVVSIYDGQIHQISAHRLPQLYGINPRDCIFAESQDSYRLRGLDLSRFVILIPDELGIYKLPKEASAKEQGE